METLAHHGAVVLMVLFAVGVIGCAVTIPVCAIKFFAVLVERSEEAPQAGYGVMPVYQSAESVQSNAAGAQPQVPAPPPQQQQEQKPAPPQTH